MEMNRSEEWRGNEDGNEREESMGTGPGSLESAREHAEREKRTSPIPTRRAASSGDGATRRRGRGPAARAAPDQRAGPSPYEVPQRALIVPTWHQYLTGVLGVQVPRKQKFSAALAFSVIPSKPSPKAGTGRTPVATRRTATAIRAIIFVVSVIVVGTCPDVDRLVAEKKYRFRGTAW
jgi:hypothetical protein